MQETVTDNDDDENDQIEDLNTRNTSLGDRSISSPSVDVDVDVNPEFVERAELPKSWRKLSKFLCDPQVSEGIQSLVVAIGSGLWTVSYVLLDYVTFSYELFLKTITVYLVCFNHYQQGKYRSVNYPNQLNLRLQVHLIPFRIRPYAKYWKQYLVIKELLLSRLF